MARNNIKDGLGLREAFDYAKKSGASKAVVNNAFSVQPKLFDIDEEDTTMVKTPEGTKSAGQAVADIGLKKALTPQDVDASVELGKEAQSDVDANKKLMDVADQVGKTLGNKMAFNKYEPRTPVFTKDDIPVEAFMYDADTKQRMAAEYQMQLLNQRRNAKDPTFEALGVQDYFPDIQNNIGVGSISSSMLGSRTRYVAQGGLVPWGVVDARRRAIEKDAAEKARIADEVKMKRFITSEQFQQKYDDHYLDKLNEYMDMAGNDASLLLDPRTELGREFIKFQTNMENAYKENKYVDGVADSVMKAHEDGKYVPDYMYSKLMDWSSGATDVEGYVSGKGSVSSLIPQFRAYDNMIKWADEKLPALESEIDVKPINPDKLNDPQYAANAQEALKFKSNMSYDQYISALSKYWDVSRLQTIVDGAFSQNNFYKGQSKEDEDKLKATLTDYLAASLKSEVEIKQDTVANKRWEMAESARDFEYKKQQDKTFYVNNDENNKALGSEIQKINANPNMTAAQKKDAINKLHSSQANFDRNASLKLGFNVGAIPLSPNEKKNKSRVDSGDLYVQYNGASYDQGGLLKLRNDLRKKYYGSDGKITATQRKELELLNEQIEFFNEVQKAGYVDAVPDKRYSTPYNTHSSGTGINVGEFIDPERPVQTLIIDEHNEFIINKSEKEKDEKGKETGFNIDVPQTLKSPMTVYVYNNGSDDNVKYKYDAIDKTSTDMTNKGEY